VQPRFPPHPQSWPLGLAGAAAFTATLAIPTVTALWWTWAAMVAAGAGLVGLRGRVSPGAAPGSGR
jgi:hypothetical protein